MRQKIRMFVLAAVAASATVAFASETMAVNVPSNFEDHGKAFPAGRYLVDYDSTMNSLTLLSKTDTKKSLTWIAGPAEYSSDMARLTLRFDSEADGTHTLRSIRLATWETPVHDKNERPVAQREVSITGGR
jgi:hypothetical protein